MKRATFFVAALFTVVAMQAQLAGDGYYRVQNAYTSRYVRVIDSYGSIDIASTTADMTAIQTIKKFENVCSDPASIIYIEKKSVGYNLRCQGTDTYSIIGYYPLITDNGNGTYKTYAEHAGMVAYLADEISSADDGVVVSNSKKSRDWYIHPVSQNDERWFGVAPDIQIGNSYALSFFAEFPFTLASPGMKVSIVTKVDEQLGVVVYKEWEGEVPGATPVIIRCTSSNPADNCLDIHKSKSKAPTDNLLKGVYFCNPKKKTTNPHHNVVNNDPATMRILGITADGSLGFVCCTDEYLPRNHAWISVPSTSPAEFRLVTEEEYADMQPPAPPVVDEEAFSKEYGDGWFQLTNATTGRRLVLQSEASTLSASLATLANEDASSASHPGTVFRIASVEGGYMLRSQGIDLTTSVGAPFRLWKDDATGAYLIFSTSNDKDTYLGCTTDGNIADDKSTALWRVTPVGTGFHLPLAGSSQQVWTALYVDFPCTLSEGTEAYVVTALHTDDIPAAILQPVNSRSLPADIPVLIHCENRNATLTIGDVDATLPTNNMLQGNLLPINVSSSYYALDESVDSPQLIGQQAGTVARNSVILPVYALLHSTLPLLTQEQYDTLVAIAEREAAEREAERIEHERIAWFAKNNANGWYRLWKKGSAEYLTLTTATREGLISKTDASSDISSCLADAGSIFRIDADTTGFLSIRSQGIDVTAILADTARIRHNDDDSYSITGLDDTWVPECITGLEGKFQPDMDFIIEDYDEYGTSAWAALCMDFPYTIQGAYELYIAVTTHATLPSVEWKRIDKNDPYGSARTDVPAGMPVLFRWLQSANTPLIFRINDHKAEAVAGNILKGNLLATPIQNACHVFAAEGKSVVFRLSDGNIHPANSAWLATSSAREATLPLMTKEEYDEAVRILGITLKSEDDDEQLFFTPLGIAIRSSLQDLQPGVYISKGHKIYIR